MRNSIMNYEYFMKIDNIKVELFSKKIIYIKELRKHFLEFFMHDCDNIYVYLLSCQAHRVI